MGWTCSQDEWDKYCVRTNFAMWVNKDVDFFLWGPSLKSSKVSWISDRISSLSSIHPAGYRARLWPFVQPVSLAIHHLCTSRSYAVSTIEDFVENIVAVKRAIWFGSEFWSNVILINRPIYRTGEGGEKCINNCVRKKMPLLATYRDCTQYYRCQILMFTWPDTWILFSDLKFLPSEAWF